MSHSDAVRTADADEVLTRDEPLTHASELPDATAEQHGIARVDVVEDGEAIREEEQPAIPVPTLKVLLYSDDRTTRQQVHLALGRRIATDLPELEIFDTATQPAVLKALETNRYDVVILDGEAQPAGGFGIAYQVKDEIANCPPVVLLVARRDDAWLATWSRAEGVSSYPIDPVRLPATVADVVRGTRSHDVTAPQAPLAHDTSASSSATSAPGLSAPNLSA